MDFLSLFSFISFPENETVYDQLAKELWNTSSKNLFATGFTWSNAARCGWRKRSRWREGESLKRCTTSMCVIAVKSF